MRQQPIDALVLSITLLLYPLTYCARQCRDLDENEFTTLSAEMFDGLGGSLLAL